MICEEALALMSAKLDGALSPDEEAELQEHLATCPDCRALMETLEGLDEKLADLREPAPEGLKKGVLYRIDQATGKAKPARRRWFGPGTALGAVAAILVLLVGLKVIPLPMLERTDSAVAKGANVAESAEEWEYNSKCNGLPDSSFIVKGNARADGMDLIVGYSACPGETQLWAEGYDYETGCASADGIIEDEKTAEGVTQVPQAASLPEGSACAALSRSENAAVLLYTEFDSASLLALLEQEEPKLYALVAELEPENVDGIIRYTTDCGTILAIQEWLLSQLPREEEMEPALEKAETDLMTRMEALDPGSGSLYRIITWTPRDHPIRWPESWPEGWADRLRTEENWQLFFPSEDYVPNADKTAYLVFFDN